MSSGKQLVKGKGGYRMIDVNEAERSPFVIEEPFWLEDAQVCKSHHSLLCLLKALQVLCYEVPCRNTIITTFLDTVASI